MPHHRRRQHRAQSRTATTRYAATLLSFTLVVTLAVFLAARVGAAGGDLDTSFNPGTGANNTVRAIVSQPDGKVVIGGSLTQVNGVARGRIARLNFNGSLDTTFDTSVGADNIVYSLALQPDGKILLGGEYTTVNGVARGRIARLNSDGTLDTTFNPSTGTDGFVYAIALQPDGKIIISGTFTAMGGIARNRIARLNPDGSLDATFDSGTGANFGITALAIQLDGKIVIGGTFRNVSGVTRTRIARLNPNGSLDTAFDTSVGANSAVDSIALQPDGKIIIGGEFTVVNNQVRGRVARLNADGTLDPSFDTSLGANDAVRSVALQPGGKILIGGDFTAVNNQARSRIARLNASGSLDATLDTSAGANNDVHAVALQPDGKIVIGGGFTTVDGVARNRIARLENATGALAFASSAVSVSEAAGVVAVPVTRTGGTDNTVIAKVTISNGTATRSLDYRFSPGTPDTLFDPGTVTNQSVRAVAFQPNGKVVIGGFFSTINGVSREGIARFNADGTHDTTFDPGTGASDAVFAVRIQPDGKILIGGFFSEFNGVARKRIARLNSDGSLDTTFDTSIGANSAVNAIALRPDGKIMIGGNFTLVDNVARNRVARLNSDGTLDTTFDTSVGANNTVRAVALQPDGKVLIGGEFTTVGGTARHRIARLNTDGSLDSAFDTGVGASNTVFAIAMQLDGKTIIGGFFTTVNNVARSSIARLNSNGSVDTTFNSNTEQGSIVRGIAIQPDGKIVFGGDIRFVGGTARTRIARVSANGNLDQTFDTSEGADATVHAVTIQPDGKILIVGDFDSVNGVARDRIARLDGDIFVTFPAGDATNKNVIIPIVNDPTTEEDETFTLTLTSGGAATLTAPVSATVTILANDPTLAPVADTYVQGADAFRDTNFGTGAEMQIKRTFNPGTGRGRRGFIRFDTSSVTGAIPSARLRIFARLTDASLPPTSMIVQKVTDTTWSETGMTWNNQPVVESPTALASITVTGATIKLYDFDVTAFIQAERAAGRTAVSFRLINQAPTGNSGVFFTSVNTKESAGNRPQLVIQN